MTKKDIILEYCKNYQTNDIDSLQNIKDVEYALKHPECEDGLLSSCPHHCGLDSFKGDCDSVEFQTWEEQKKQCKQCWSRALAED